MKIETNNSMSYDYGLRLKNGQSAAKLGEIIFMYAKMKQENYEKKLNLIYPDNKIKILEWNGYASPIIFLCDKCGETHHEADARLLLNKKQYCRKENNNIRFDKKSFNERINLMHNANVTILKFSGLSAPVKYLCPQCGKEKSCNCARTLIIRYSLCNDCDGRERNIVRKKIDNLFKNSDKYELVTWRGANKKLTIKCLNCNFVYDRFPSSVLSCFDNCPNCNNGAMKMRYSLEEIQNILDSTFKKGAYKILDYQGQLSKKSKIKCLECNFIFETRLSTFTNSRGCPKCKRFKSKGEQLVQKYLEDNDIKFEAQKRFKDCNFGLSSFDFCVYEQNNKMILIEVNGIQHYADKPNFRGLDDNLRRDKIKEDYCKLNNITLVIIPYYKLNRIEEILSFLKGSTTISEESKE